MQYRQLGNSDIEVSAVVFGAGGIPDADRAAALEAAINMGITTIDTAPVYGFGVSEEMVGKVVAGKREQVRILTKYGFLWDTSKGRYIQDKKDLQGNPRQLHAYAAKDSVLRECEQSLKRLRTDYIDVYLYHFPDPTTPLEETFAAIDKLLKDGKIRTAGVSNFDVKQMALATGLAPVVVTELGYSMVNRHIEQDVLPWCRDHNVGVIGYSPLQDGLLSGKFRADTELADEDRRRDHPFFTRENRARVARLLDNIRDIAERHSCTMAQLVINWTINRPGMTSALVGMRNLQYAIESAKATDFRLSKEEVEQIDTFVSATEMEKQQ